jgi:hypothetical protein
MIPLIILAIFTLVLIGFLVFQVRSRYSAPSRTPGSSQLLPVDLEAFDNLTDPEEEQFLRSNLSPPQFRSVQRSRIRAARAYVAILSKNVGVLVSVGQSARYHPDPQIAASGQDLMQRAISLKMWCLLSLLRMNAAFLFPALLSPSNQYLMVTYMATNLPDKIAA